MPNIPSLEEMLKAGLHFGHHSSKRDPKMAPYIYSERNKINIIDLELTQSKLKEALEYVSQVAATGGVVLFVGSKNQARPLIEKYAKDCGMPYVNYRWLGGTFTNLGSIVKLIKKLKTLEQKQSSGELDVYTKKEQLEFQRTITKLNQLVGGIKNMERLPQAVFVVDVKKERTVVAEANKKNVPIVAITDTNANPDKVNYPIPANDDAVKSIELITSLIAQAINEGKGKLSASGGDNPMNNKK